MNYKMFAGILINLDQIVSITTCGKMVVFRTPDDGIPISYECDTESQAKEHFAEIRSAISEMQGSLDKKELT